jgi:hypothetical protein
MAQARALLILAASGFLSEIEALRPKKLTTTTTTLASYTVANKYGCLETRNLYVAKGWMQALSIEHVSSEDVDDVLIVRSPLTCAQQGYPVHNKSAFAAMPTFVIQTVLAGVEWWDSADSINANKAIITTQKVELVPPFAPNYHIVKEGKYCLQTDLKNLGIGWQMANIEAFSARRVTGVEHLTPVYPGESCAQIGYGVQKKDAFEELPTLLVRSALAGVEWWVQ